MWLLKQLRLGEWGREPRIMKEVRLIRFLDRGIIRLMRGVEEGLITKENNQFPQQNTKPTLATNFNFKVNHSQISLSMPYHVPHHNKKWEL